MEVLLDTVQRPWFEPLVRGLENPALRFAFSLVHDREVAEDIVQEAFARAWASPRTPLDETQFKRWLYRIILNLARDRGRQKSRWAALMFWAPPPADPLDEVERRADDEALVRALRRLSLRDRQAVHLRYFENQSFEDAARTLGTSEPHARVIVHRALAKLRRHLKDQVPFTEVRA
jgi:RNA polymerase sigma-70 factor (ECF subfamily)